MIEDSASLQIIQLIENGDCIRQICAKLRVSKDRVKAVRKRYIAKTNPKIKISFSIPNPKTRPNNKKEDYQSNLKLELNDKDNSLYKEVKAKKLKTKK